MRIVGTLVVTSSGVQVTGNSSINGTLNLNSHQINNVTDPSVAQDAATKGYVDARIGNPTFASLAKWV